MVELASVALPGVAGLVAITAAGGAVGYRQANSGRYIRADAARFLT
jgi:ammonia channel protein AmtB